MINRESRPVEVLTYTGVDSVGQKRMGLPTTETVEMFIKTYKQENVADPRYLNIDLIGLTKARTITTKNVIKIDDDKYSVKYTISTPRYLVVFMEKNKNG